MINPQDTPEHRVAMNVRAMQEAISDLLDMAGDKYGLPYVMRDVSDLKRMQNKLALLLTLLQVGQLQKIS